MIGKRGIEKDSELAEGLDGEVERSSDYSELYRKASP
jgi:hypothetical protein